MPPSRESADCWKVEGSLPSLEDLAPDVGFRALLDEAPLLSGAVLPNGVVLDVSDRALAFAGAKREEVVGVVLWESALLARSPDRERVKDALLWASQGEVVRVGASYHGADGDHALVTFSARPVKSAEGSVRFLLVEGVRLAADGSRGPISEERARVNLRETFEGPVDSVRPRDVREGERPLRAPELAHIGVVKSRAPFGVEDTVWSDEVYRICGRDPARGPMSFAEVRRTLIHPGDREAVARELRDAIAEHRPGVLECRAQREDGSLRLVQARFGAELAEDGAPVRWIGALRDVTEQRELERETLHAQKLAALARFTAGIAHEYNNLLMGIQGCTKLALRRIGEDHPASRFVMEAEQAAKRGASLTRQLLDFGVRRECTEDTLDLDRFLARNEAMLRAVVGERIELTMDLAAPRWRPRADPVQLEQALVNLVLNARDAMPEGGSLAITTREVEVGPTETGGVEPGAYVVLSLLDTGAGMDRETREHAFEPFFTSKPGEGSGLGLSTVYGLLRNEGGDVTLESEPGLGTTVTLYLPRAVGRDGMETSRALSPTPANGVAPRSGRERVLVVEDEPLIRMTLRGYLEPHGYEVVEACDVAEAYLHLLRSGPFGLVITDMMLPGGTGPQVAARAHVIDPATPVIFMSAHSARLLQRSGQIPVGAVLLQKPFGEGALMAEIEPLLGPARASRRSAARGDV